jgi:hypothetical protein
MVPWFRWINYINPIAYTFESLLVNEFDGRIFPCAAAAPSGPGYEDVTGPQFICNVPGAVAGETTVQGRLFVETAYEYQKKNMWRNLGIIWVFVVIFLGTHLYATEKILAKKSKGEVLVFPRSKMPKVGNKQTTDDAEAGTTGRSTILDGNAAVDTKEVVGGIQRQTKVFHWDDVCYDIKIKKEQRRILNHIDGWVKPGTLTALMVSSSRYCAG